MSIGFQMTARDMVTQAMREIGVLASGENPTSDELADGILRLNSMLKAYAAKGLNLWRDTDGSVDFAAGVSAMSITGAVSVGSVRVLLASGDERPLALWSRDDILAMPNKATRGVPIAYAVLTATSGLSIQLWPVPAEPVTIQYSYGRITADVVQPSDPVDVPQMFQEAIWTMLAVRLAPTFGKARTDAATVQIVAQRATEMERDMLDWDRPDAYYMSGEDDYR